MKPNGWQNVGQAGGRELGSDGVWLACRDEWMRTRLHTHTHTMRGEESTQTRRSPNAHQCRSKQASGCWLEHSGCCAHCLVCRPRALAAPSECMAYITRPFCVWILQRRPTQYLSCSSILLSQIYTAGEPPEDIIT